MNNSQGPSLTRWHSAAIACVIVGAALASVAGVVNHQSLGVWQVAIYVGVVLVISGAYWFRREVTSTEHNLEQREQVLAERSQALQTENAELRESRKLLEREFAEQGNQLLRREEVLAHRLTTYHEWQEFPLPTDLSDSSAPPPPSDTELAELLRKDRQLRELLQAETERLFERIRANAYMVEGKFQLPLVRDDLLALITKCAQVYRPDVQQPLLDTSLERILRALSRSALQLLVVLENLPVDLRNYNLSSLYAYVRQAVSAYGTYQVWRPYWNYANTAFYLGRFALGANPISLGAWWFISTLSKEGAQALATRLVHRQALAFLQDVVRVIGYEVAATYGGDFRQRDANWIYAAELTALVSRFPLSRDSLRQALKEIGSLTLRSEYDRVFLTRCLASGSSARPEQYHAAAFLTMGERQAIAQRLEFFLESFIHGKTQARVQPWRQAVENRLQVKLRVNGAKPAISRETQLTEALRGVVGYLLSLKQFEPEEAVRFLSRTHMWRELPSDVKSSLERGWLETPPFLFVEPDLDPDGDVTPLFLEDLAYCAAQAAPRGGDTFEFLRDVALYLRQPEQLMRSLWIKQLQAAIQERSTTSAVVKQLSWEAMPAVLDLLGDEILKFLYKGLTIEPALPEKPNVWLLGTHTRLILLAIDSSGPSAWWKADATLTCEVQRGLVSRELLLRGGIWLRESPVPRTIRVAGPLLRGGESYFQPLQAWLANGKLERREE